MLWKLLPRLPPTHSPLGQSSVTRDQLSTQPPAPPLLAGCQDLDPVYTAWRLGRLLEGRPGSSQKERFRLGINLSSVREEIELPALLKN